MSYSSALFIDPENVRENLEEAQERKIAAILVRLDLGEGDRLLEIGCGWGGLAQSALERKSISYDGLTLSPRQKTLAEEKLAAAGRSEEHTSELQSLMRNSYAVFCLKKKNKKDKKHQ